MHGEFKVPGGKLVVVDLETTDGVIHDFRLAGDFFLEPDSALAAINGAVNGLPADADAARIAKAIQAGLPDDASLLGFTPDAVATAIRRALASATGWRDYDWQLIMGPALDPVVQMALDLPALPATSPGAPWRAVELDVCGNGHRYGLHLRTRGNPVQVHIPADIHRFRLGKVHAARLQDAYRGL